MSTPKSTFLYRVPMTEEAIVEYIRRVDYVTFADLVTRIGDDASGDCSIKHATDTNVVFYSGLSEGFCAVILRLLDGERLHMHSAPVLAYLIDGGVLTLPVARRPPAGGYKRPRWLPVYLRTVSATRKR